MPSRISEILAILGSGEDGGSSVYDILARIFEGLDQRLAVIENVSSSLAALQEQLATSSQGVVDAALAPVLASITARADLGAILTASSVSEQTVGIGTKTFVLAPEASWPMFAPAHILSISAADDPLVYMYGRKVSYDPETGTLVVDVLASAGAGTLSSWTIAPGSLATMASALAVAAAGEDITGPTLQIALTQIATALAHRQPLDENLTALAALTYVANRIIGTGSDGAPDLFPVTAFGKTLLSMTSGDVLRSGIGAAPLNSPGLTGTPTAPTAPISADSNQIVNVTALRAAVANLVNSAPAILDTFKELATALGNDPNFATTMATSLSQKLDKAEAGTAAGFRNKLINGDFAISQRGNTFTIAPGASAYTADRWRVQNDTNQTLTVAIQTIDYLGIVNHPRLRLSFDTAPTTGSVIVMQRIEGVGVLAGKTATVSLHQAGPAGMVGTIATKQFFGSGGSASVFPSSATFTFTTSMGIIKRTLSVPAISGKTVGAGDHLEIAISMPIRSTAPVTLVRVAAVEGDATAEADPFSTRHPQQELALCQRYLLVTGVSTGTITVGHGYASTTTQCRILVPTPVTLRATPSVLATIGNLRVVGDGIFVVLDSISPQTVLRNGIFLHANVAAGLVANKVYGLATPAEFITFDAEL